jgi:general stress protein 26
MDEALKAKIVDVLGRHRIMSLATQRPDGWPQATTVGYVEDGLRLYFMCGKRSQKAHNLAHDDRVSLTIDNDTSEPMAISGVSMAARAHVVEDPAELQRMLGERLFRKYPEYAPMMKDMNTAEMACFRLDPEVISLLDYTKGFGHSDLIRVEAADLSAA